MRDQRSRIKGIAARAGHWSARHRKLAIIGWLVFVFVAMNVTINGSSAPQKLTTTETLSGESAAASRTLDHAGFDRPAFEQVLVQGKSDVTSGEGRAAIAQVVHAVGATGRVTDIRSPLTKDNAGQVTKDHRSALVLFAMKGKADAADKRVQPVLDAVSRVASAHAALPACCAPGDRPSAPVAVTSAQAVPYGLLRSCNRSRPRMTRKTPQQAFDKLHSSHTPSSHND